MIAPSIGGDGLTRRVYGTDHMGTMQEISVIEERPLTIFLNGQEIVTAMTICDYPEYLALGFLRNQGMLGNDETVQGIDFDQELDRNGNDRDSDIFELRGGVQVDLGEKLTGEIALGYVNESFDDPLLEDLDAFTVNGLVNWSPVRDTQVGLTLGTTTNDSTTANENGSIIYNGRLDINRQITDRFSVNAFADAQVETNDDNNTTLQVGLGTQYWVNRFMAITSQVDYQRFETDAPNSSFDATSGQVGVRLQR